MGLFDSIAGQALNALGGNGGAAQGGMLDAIGGLIGDAQGGGLPGLLGQFEQHGLGAQVASWVGTGENLPVSAEQIQAVLGNGTVAAIAAKLGFSPEQAASQLAALLPGVVDRLTPGGQLPDNGALGGLLDLVKHFK